MSFNKVCYFLKLESSEFCQSRDSKTGEGEPAVGGGGVDTWFVLEHNVFSAKYSLVFPRQRFLHKQWQQMMFLLLSSSGLDGPRP